MRKYPRACLISERGGAYALRWTRGNTRRLICYRRPTAPIPTHSARAFISDIRKRHATDDLDHVPDVVLGVGGAQEDRLALGELRGAIGRLPAAQRAALLMVALQGMSYDEVAQITGCAVGSAKSRVFRARRQLQAMLLGKEEASSNTSSRCIVPASSRTNGIGASSTGAAD